MSTHTYVFMEKLFFNYHQIPTVSVLLFFAFAVSLFAQTIERLQICLFKEKINRKQNNNDVLLSGIYIRDYFFLQMNFQEKVFESTLSANRIILSPSYFPLWALQRLPSYQ